MRLHTIVVALFWFGAAYTALMVTIHCPLWLALSVFGVGCGLYEKGALDGAEHAMGVVAPLLNLMKQLGGGAGE